MIFYASDHKVDGKTFIDITETELKSELGIAIFGPKKTVLRLIEEAKEQVSLYLTGACIEIERQ